MRSRTTDEGVFFRSLASRGHLGGLSRHTGEVVTLMDAFGFDYILIAVSYTHLDVYKRQGLLRLLLTHIWRWFL